MTSPTNQPAPAPAAPDAPAEQAPGGVFAPPPSYPGAALVAAPAPRRRSRLPAILGAVVAAVVIAGVAFAGGYTLGQGNATANAASTGGGAADSLGGGGPSASGFGGRLGRGRFGAGGAAVGTIASVAPGQVTITLANGSQKLVLVGSSTTVTKITTTQESLSTLAAGDAVTIEGTANPDGSITADRIVLGNLGILGRGRGAKASPAPSATP